MLQLEVNENEKIYIEFFGRFQVSYRGKIYLQDTGSSKKVMTLLQYLIFNRNVKITNEQLISALFLEEGNKNPAAVLKNLIYRLRTMIKQTGLPEHEYILQLSGSYFWNPDVPCHTDVEIFETCHIRAHSEDLPEKERIIFFERAIDRYKGKFLADGMGQIWMLSAAAYYDGLFKECIDHYYRLVKDSVTFHRTIPLLQKAIEIDPFDEKTYIILIRTYCSLEKYSEALLAYEKITELLNDELGVKPSEELLRLYELAMGKLNRVEESLGRIDDSLREITGEGNGAYYCTYALFKAIFQFVLRVAERAGTSVSIILFTITDAKGEMPVMQKRVMTMKNFKHVIGTGLRFGDLFARYSPTQYIVLLMGSDYINSGKVAQRILDKYQHEFQSRSIRIAYQVKRMEGYAERQSAQ